MDQLLKTNRYKISGIGYSVKHHPDRLTSRQNSNSKAADVGRNIHPKIPCANRCETKSKEQESFEIKSAVLCHCGPRCLREENRMNLYTRASVC
jgi:hypothetical protein